MIVFLIIVGELATVIGSAVIMGNATLDSILEIPKNGYKVDKEVIEEIQKQQAEEKKVKTSLFNRILGTILLLTPGVNLLNASIKGYRIKKSVINDPKVKEFLVPMTEEEKEQYAKIEGKLQKVAFTAFTSGREDEEEEFIGFNGNRTLVLDHGLTSLYYEELMPLEYTLDEVKRLNDATTYSYRIGQIDGKNVAVIGIPNSESSISRIKFKSEDYNITHDYVKMSEEEAQDKTFTVYPFTIHDDTKDDVEKIIQEIKQSRIDSATKANVDVQFYSEAPGVEIGYAESDVPLEDMMSSMEDSIFEGETKDQEKKRTLGTPHKN